MKRLLILILIMNNITNNTMYTVQERHILLLSFRVELETILFE